MCQPGNTEPLQMTRQLVKNVLLQLNPYSLSNNAFPMNHGPDMTATGRACPQPAYCLLSLRRGARERIIYRVWGWLVVNLVQVRQRQAQKLLLVPPLHLTCGELSPVRRRRRRVRYLGDEIRRALLCFSIRSRSYGASHLQLRQCHRSKPQVVERGEGCKSQWQTQREGLLGSGTISSSPPW